MTKRCFPVAVFLEIFQRVSFPCGFWHKFSQDAYKSLCRCVKNQKNKKKKVTNITKEASDQAAFVNAGFSHLQKDADNQNATCLFTNLQD